MPVAPSAAAFSTVRHLFSIVQTGRLINVDAAGTHVPATEILSVLFALALVFGGLRRRAEHRHGAEI